CARAGLTRGLAIAAVAPYNRFDVW
nr:immunoglobulin heavy chain junction region [Macaca mulatta]MOV89716.1 immunoglobulin heavy chain junction region [Macaca mulatta]